MICPPSTYPDLLLSIAARFCSACTAALSPNAISGDLRGVRLLLGVATGRRSASSGDGTSFSAGGKMGVPEMERGFMPCVALKEDDGVEVVCCLGGTE